ncbi:MAG TPA: hypothetical protein VGG29_18395 [Caulobacteraceae bacterium]|jgi:uncharacterized protein YndB with AHSA1/START domain
MSETPEKSEERDAEALVFEVDLEAPPEKVWRALATSELREAWLGAPEAGPAEVAGERRGERLDLVWPTREGESLVSFEVSPADGGSHLTITHRAPQPATVLAFRPRAVRAKPVRAAGGWRMAA